MALQWLRPASGVYRIAALHTKNPWTVANGSTEQGAIVRQEPVADSRSQLWRIEPATATATATPACYKIVNVKSGLALTVTDGNRRNNALVRQAEYVGQDHQHFIFEQREGGAIVLIARHSGRSICVQGARRENEAPIHQYDYVGVADQQIELTAVE